MLSADLDALAGHFADWARGDGVQMQSAGCAHIAGLLHEMAAQARGLEGAAVRAAARWVPDALAADNVVLLCEQRQRRPGRAVPNPIDGGNVPGGAA